MEQCYTYMDLLGSPRGRPRALESIGYLHIRVGMLKMRDESVVAVLRASYQVLRSAHITKSFPFQLIEASMGVSI